MPIGDIYPNLPGTLLRLHDYGLTIRPPQPYRTDAVCLIGVASDGPVRNAIRISSITDAERTFGKIDTTSSTLMKNRGITRACYEAFFAGCTEILVCRVNGTTASTNLTASSGTNVVYLETAYGGSAYNANTVVIDATTLTINAVGGSASYTLASYVNYTDLCAAINADLGTHKTNAYVLDQFNNLNLDTGTFTFTGGTDEFNLTDAQYSDRLNDTYTILEGKADFDYAVPIGAGLVASGASTGADPCNFALNLARFCCRNTIRNNEMVGIIPFQQLNIPTPVTVNARALALTNTSMLHYLKNAYVGGAVDPSTITNMLDDETNLPIDIGRWISIIAGPSAIFNTTSLNNYSTTGEALYAGLVSGLSISTSPTNKTINGVRGLSYEFSEQQLNDVTGARFVTFKNSQNTTVVTDSPTYAASNSDYKRMSTMRVTNAVTDAIRRTVQQYIGQPNDTITRNSIASQIQGALQSIQDMRAIQFFTFTMSATPAQQIDGKLVITLNVVPMFEIKQIVINVYLMPPENFNSVSQN